MESRAKLLGHSIHQMLIVIPLGMFIGAVVFDALYLWTGYSTLAAAAYWNMVGGIAGGLLAAVFGLIDWFAIPSGTRAKRIGLLHGASMVVVVGAFGFAWLMRSTAGDISGDIAPTAGIFLIEAAALLVGGVSGWLGGELVDRLAVGVDDGAHLNAPSSLSGLPANRASRP
jgi:uncharacterized membrane protein